MANVPYLVGNTYKRDHIFGLTVTKAEWIAEMGGTFPNDFFPVSFTRQQLMVCAWQAKKWSIAGSGSNSSGSFSFSAELIHSVSTSYPLTEAPSKRWLIGDVDNLRDTGNPAYWFSGPMMRRAVGFNDLFLQNTSSTPGALGVAYMFGTGDWVNTFPLAPRNNISLVVYDPDTKLFWPFLLFFIGGLETFIVPGRYAGSLTIVSTGVGHTMDNVVVPFYDGGVGSVGSISATMTALTYW